MALKASAQPFERSTSGVVPFWPWMITILPLPPACFEDVLADSLGRSDEIGREEGVAGCAVGIAVDVDDGNAGGLGELDRNRRGGGTRRNVDQRVDVLRQKVLDLVDLRRAVALGVDGDDLDAALLGFGLN